MMNYIETVNWLESTGKIIYADPNISMSIQELESVAKSMMIFDWVKPVALKLINPLDTDSKSVKECMFMEFRPGRLPQAMIEFEVTGNTSKDEILKKPTIHFFDSRFLTAGTLFHEMAHMHWPFNDHGDEFHAALNKLKEHFIKRRGDESITITYVKQIQDQPSATPNIESDHIGDMDTDMDSGTSVQHMGREVAY